MIGALMFIAGFLIGCVVIHIVVRLIIAGGKL